MKVVIVGSGGFIGSHLNKFLQSEGIQVLGASSADGTGIVPSTGILPDDFSIVPETDLIVYLAQSPYYNMLPEKFPHLVNVNVLSAVKTAELAHRAKVRRFIYASTGNVYEPGFTPFSESSPLRRDDWYSLSKIHAEEMLSLYKNDMDLIIMRIFGVYGPGQTDKLVPKLLNSVMQDKEIFIEKNPENPSDLSGLKISLCYIDDIVEIISNIIKKGGPSIINIAGNEPASLRQMANVMGQYLGKKPVLKVADRCRRGDLIADISLLNSILKPQFTSLESGLKETIETMRQ
jgi:nucleoside-diphosphate-sugar epimerase